jgi:predicted DsbA family dithiol-disulfide isomerase
VLTLFHDFTDPASALAVRRLQRLADEGLAVEFAGFEAVGVEATLPVSLNLLAALAALREAARLDGVELRRPPAQPPTARAHVVARLAERHGLGASWRHTCYTAYLRDGADIGAVDVLVTLAAGAGLQASEARAAASDPAALAAFRRQVGGHRRAGIGGVPVLRAHGTLVPGLLSEQELRELALL